MPFLVNAIPKSGTHLLCRALDLLGLGRNGSVRFAPASGERFPSRVSYDANGLFKFDGDEIPLAAATVTMVTKEKLIAMAERFAGVEPTAYCDAHMAWSKPAANILAAAGIKMLIILREPRAVAWSHVDWIVSDGINHLHRDLFLPWCLKDRMRCEFFGLSPETQTLWPPFVPLLARYRNMAGWLDYPDLFVTTFEALVGERGGGSRAEQARELQAIANFTGTAACNPQGMQDLLWGASPTFRAGKIDGWREHASELPAGIEDQIAEMTDIVARLRRRRGAAGPSL